ncbi:Lysophospholipase, alpha-beta hydrolase superfamily [Pseudoxanthomonas sp. GM95]|nr:Lysophospholipase, alpha-beta hydrolase superfamily [Pseudoxanthomonas sp. GM95]
MCLLGGCASHISLGNRLSHPTAVQAWTPRDSAALFERLPQHTGTVITPEQVRLFWRAFPAGDYRFESHYRSADGRSEFGFSVAGLPADPNTFPAVPARDTVLLLHGWGMESSSMLPWALFLAQHDYRTITVDLRNHGRSSRAPMGYGMREARDVNALISQLRAQGEITGSLHVLGVSYGAATALFAAALQPGQIDGVISIASFDNAADAIRGMVPAIRDTPASGLRQALTRRWMQWRYGQVDVDAAIDDASRRLHLDLEQVDTTQAIASASSCVLLVHGARDSWIAPRQAEHLHAASPRSALLMLPEDDHISAPLRLDLLAEPLLAWLSATPPRGQPCPTPLLAPISVTGSTS